MRVITALPRVVFVLGKGGVGRSTVATALGAALARQGKNVLVFEWTLEESIAPWFGHERVGIDPLVVSPGLSVANFCLDDALEAYFVGHLGMGLFYRRVVHGRAVHSFVEAAPGIAEMMFLGHVCFLSGEAEKERGLHFDHILVDTPAAGHGASILDLPATLASMHATGLLGAEMKRVEEMLGSPEWTGTLAVSLAEELSAEETLELVPRVTRSMGRAPLAVMINRSTSRFVGSAAPHIWRPLLLAQVSDAIAGRMAQIEAEFCARAAVEKGLRRSLAGGTLHGCFSLDEQFALLAEPSPRNIVAALAEALTFELAGAG